MALSQQLCHQGPFGAFSLSQNLLTIKLIFPIRDYLCSILPRWANFPINRIAELTPVACRETNRDLAAALVAARSVVQLVSFAVKS